MLEQLGEILWGPAMLVLLCGIGLYFTVGTGMLGRLGQLFRFTLGNMQKTADGVSPFAAMTTALASCLGTGNIAGVASALLLGGPGALFWMWVSAVLSMATKYAEVTLAIQFRKRSPDGIWRGGPMYYMEHGLGWKGLATVFAAVCLVSTVGTGNLTQVGAMTGALVAAFDVPPLWVGIGAMIFVALTIFGGIRAIAQVSARLIPFVSVLYTVGAVAVLVINADKIVPAFISILEGAFGLSSAAGGVVGFAMTRAMRFGISRGVFSNEAGMGSSPMAHAAAQTDNPAKQGLWGALEVFIDTLVLCTLTGLAILVSGVLTPTCQVEGTALTGRAFATVFGASGPDFVAISVSLFALTSIMGWSCYGEAACRYLFGERKTPLLLYRLCYLGVIPLGALMNMEQIWQLADVLNSAMMLPNLVAIVALSGTVFALTKRYLPRK